MLLEAEAFEVVLSAMQRYPAVEDVQEVCLCFLGNLVTDNSDAKVMLGPRALPLVLAALRNYPEGGDVREEAWRTLINLLGVKDNRPVTAAAGGVEAITEALAAAEEADTIRFASLALLQLIKVHEIRVAVAATQAAPVLKAALAKYAGDAELKEVAKKLKKKLEKVEAGEGADAE